MRRRRCLMPPKVELDCIDSLFSLPPPLPFQGWGCQVITGSCLRIWGFVILLKSTSAVLWRHRPCYQHTSTLVSTTRAWTKNPQLLSWESYKLSCSWLWIYLSFFCLFVCLAGKLKVIIKSINTSWKHKPVCWYWPNLFSLSAHQLQPPDFWNAMISLILFLAFRK